MAYSLKEIKDTTNTICKRVSQGEAVRTILLESDMPSSHVFFEWIDDDEEKRKQYARATKERADTIFDEIIEIADENNADVYIDDGVAKIDGNTVQRSRLKIDARKWVASKLNPKKYGDSSLLKLADPDGNELKINAIFTTDLLIRPDVLPHDSTSENSGSQ